MLKIGVLGAGHLGKIHIKLIQSLRDNFELVGFYDADEENASIVAQKFDTTAFDSQQSLIDAVDCVDIVTPTSNHFECAAAAIKASKHIFIEKPIAQTTEEARQLRALAEEADVCVQIGHVERFNPAFRAAVPYFEQPMFIETHRLAQFNPRGTDVPVILDLMIHDIDVILSVVNSTVRRISASGVPVISDTPDIANARIEFDNGCVANLTASRISLKNMRKSRFFQKNAYIAVDFLEKEMEVVQMEDLEGEAGPYDMVMEMGDDRPSKKILFDKPSIPENNAILEELRNFSDAIANDESPIVTLEDGLNALDVGEQILDKLKLSGSVMESNIQR